MSVVTSQKIAKYYDSFREIDITFSKEVISAINLKSDEIFLKCAGEQWPCIIFSTSMSGAKVIATLKEEHFEKIRKANNQIFLRFSFMKQGKNDLLNFFIPSKVSGYNPYNKKNPNVNFLSLVFTGRPPDDLITILGSVLDANENAKLRKEERVIITTDSLTKLGFTTKDVFVNIENIPRKAILRDVSFSGIKVIVMGVPKFLMQKNAIITIPLESNKNVELKGNIVRVEKVEGRDDLAALGILLSNDAVPVDYKMRLNEYLSEKKEELK